MIVSRARRRLYVDREKEEQGEKSNEKDKRARLYCETTSSSNWGVRVFALAHLIIGQYFSSSRARQNSFDIKHLVTLIAVDNNDP